VRDEVRRAYATLGLPFGASADQIKRRYRLLIRTWHPDRFQSDPIGQATASEHLVHVNQAYHLLERATSSAQPTRPATPSPDVVSHPPRATRLSREELEGIVRAIGTESPLDSALGWFESIIWPIDPRGLRAARRSHIVIALAVVAVVIAVDVKSGSLIADSLLLGVIIITALLTSVVKMGRS
jgi:hypothetical protein